MTEGQKKARGCQRWLSFYAVLLMVLAAVFADRSAQDTAIICSFAMLSACAVIDAVRALAKDPRP